MLEEMIGDRAGQHEQHRHGEHHEEASADHEKAPPCKSSAASSCERSWSARRSSRLNYRAFEKFFPGAAKDAGEALAVFVVAAGFVSCPVQHVVQVPAQSRNRRRISLQGSAANLHVNRRRNGGETGNTRPIVRAATARYEPTALGNLRLELENRRGFTRNRLDRTYDFPIDDNFERFQFTRK